jgi:hypothetical protein
VQNDRGVPALSVLDAAARRRDDRLHVDRRQAAGVRGRLTDRQQLDQRRRAQNPDDRHHDQRNHHERRYGHHSADPARKYHDHTMSAATPTQIGTTP